MSRPSAPPAVDMRPTVDDEANAAWAEVNNLRSTLKCREQEIKTLVEHLGYALDALEGSSRTGWTTDDARVLIESLSA